MTAIVSYAAVAPNGTESHSMQNRITWTLRTVGHNLRIVHEHTSAPIGFEDMKAILKNYRQSPRKVRLVSDLIKGRTVDDALLQQELDDLWMYDDTGDTFGNRIVTDEF